MNTAQRLRALAKRTALDGIGEELMAIADDMEAASMGDEAALLAIAESVGLIGPGSLVGDTHNAAVRFGRALTQALATTERRSVKIRLKECPATGEVLLATTEPVPASQTERESFETWARPHGYDLRRNDVLGHYSSLDTSRAWSGFRAGRATQQATTERKGEPVEDRAAFEKAARQEGCVNLRRVGDAYVDRRTLRCYRIWQKARGALYTSPQVPEDHPLMVFAIECEMGALQEHEVPLRARLAIRAARKGVA